jgi:hypothetical protein
LELEELKAIFSVGNAKVDEDVWKKLIHEVDENDDGQVGNIYLGINWETDIIF